MQNFHEGSRGFFPNVECVLPGRTGANVFAVAGKAALLPHGLVDQVLQLLIGLRVSVGVLQHVGGLVDADDSIGGVDQERFRPSAELDGLDGRRAAHLLSHSELRDDLNRLAFLLFLHGPVRDGHDRDLAPRVAREDVLAPVVVSGHDLRVGHILVPGSDGQNAVTFVSEIDDDRRMFHGTDEELVFPPRVELHLEDGAREPEALFALAGQHVPDGDVVVGGRRDELPAGSRPRERANRVDVGADDLGDAAGQKVPDDDAAVVAAHGQQGAESVEVERDGHGDAVQRAVIFLGVILPERFEQLQIHLVDAECIKSQDF